MFSTTCFDILRAEEESSKIITLVKDLDNYLGGGIRTGLITEFCGCPGSGKTQMALQLCVNVQIPLAIGGVGGKALFIDTNQGFNPNRFKEIAEYMQGRLQKLNQKVNSAKTALKDNSFNTIDLLNNVSYIYCSKYLELMSIVSKLREMLSTDNDIKLIVIDSFSFPLRTIENVSTRTSIIYEILTELQSLAVTFKVAVVLTNELTTRIFSNNAKIYPALGDSHSHKINQRITLSRNSNTGTYVALIDKSVMAPKVVIPFEIKSCGIRGAT